MILPLFIAASLAYGAASFVYGGTAGAKMERRHRRLGDVFLAIAGMLHIGCVGAQCVEGDHPFASVFLVVSFGALVAVLGYFVVARRKPMPGLAAILAPVGLVGLVLGVLFGDNGAERLPATDLLVKSHIGLATAGIAGLMLAAGVAAIYLTMERRIRNKVFRPRPGGVSLAGLDRLHHRLMLLVTPVFTLAIVTGVLWILQAGGPDMLGPRWIEILAAAIAWLASVSLLVTRAAFGMRGRKAAALTLFAFVCIVVILLFYGLRGGVSG